jgi:hypothetical protein
MPTDLDIERIDRPTGKPLREFPPHELIFSQRFLPELPRQAICQVSLKRLCHANMAEEPRFPAPHDILRRFPIPNPESLPHLLSMQRPRHPDRASAFLKPSALTRTIRRLPLPDAQQAAKLVQKTHMKAMEGEKPKNSNTYRRRGEGVEPSGERNARQAGFEDRWGHRAPSSSTITSIVLNSVVKSPKAQWRPRE